MPCTALNKWVKRPVEMRISAFKTFYLCFELYYCKNDFNIHARQLFGDVIKFVATMVSMTSSAVLSQSFPFIRALWNYHSCRCLSRQGKIHLHLTNYYLEKLLTLYYTCVPLDSKPSASKISHQYFVASHNRMSHRAGTHNAIRAKIVTNQPVPRRERS